MARESRWSAGGIPIGFEDDRDYLAAWQRWAVSRLLVVPPQVRQLRSPENARYVTLLYLLNCCRPGGDLRVESDVSHGIVGGCAAVVGSDVHGPARWPRTTATTERNPTIYSSHCRGTHRRADELRGIFAGSHDTSQKLDACWPRLALVSCWADASSAMYVPPLRATLPKVALQPKGLLATEGVVSLPLVGATGSALALRSHFLEFVDVRTAETAPATTSPPGG